ncbi:hypothetical protein SAY87_027751 [Trapa incisa]|uniref:Uncharacterized protein n=1 Tax=Trapa incisa TaxID=236973 RepID=A0AAN7PIQ6_9MYRT|nr:hypothetical protein SAY87_027751 [Trapa incisa]
MVELKQLIPPSPAIRHPMGTAQVTLNFYTSHYAGFLESVVSEERSHVLLPGKLIDINRPDSIVTLLQIEANSKSFSCIDSRVPSAELKVIRN